MLTKMLGWVGQQAEVHIILRGPLIDDGVTDIASLVRRYEFNGWMEVRKFSQVDLHLEGSELQLRNFLAALDRLPVRQNADTMVVKWLPSAKRYHDFRVWAAN